MGLNETQYSEYSVSTNVNYLTAYKILITLYCLQNQIPKQSNTTAFKEDSKLVILAHITYSILLPGTVQDT